jgi:ribosomal protein L5
LASVDDRRNAAISDIGLSHGTVAKQIADFRGLMKANFQLDGSSQFGI